MINATGGTTSSDQQEKSNTSNETSIPMTTSGKVYDPVSEIPQSKDASSSTTPSSAEKKQLEVHCSHDWYDVACLTKCASCGLAFSRFFTCPFLFHSIMNLSDSICAVYRRPNDEVMIYFDLTEQVLELLEYKEWNETRLISALSLISSRLVFDYDKRVKAKQNLVAQLKSDLVYLMREEGYLNDVARLSRF